MGWRVRLLDADILGYKFTPTFDLIAAPEPPRCGRGRGYWNGVFFPYLTALQPVRSLYTGALDFIVFVNTAGYPKP